MLRVESTFFLLFFFLPFHLSNSICQRIEQRRIWVFWGLDNYLLWVWKCNRVLRILENLCCLPGAHLTLAWQLNHIIVSDAAALLFWNILEASHFICEEHCAHIHRAVSLTFGENENSWVPLQERVNFKPVSLATRFSLSLSRDWKIWFWCGAKHSTAKEFGFSDPTEPRMVDRRWTSLVQSCNSRFKNFKTQESYFSLIGLVSSPVNLKASNKNFPGIMVHNYIDFWSLLYDFLSLRNKFWITRLLKNTR